MEKLKNKILLFVEKDLSRYPWSRFLVFNIFRVIKKYPKIFIIEPTNLCNGTCPLCPIGLGTAKRGKGQIGIDEYKKLIAEIKSFAQTVIFNFAGEPTLHVQIGELIKIAKTAGLKVIIGTNGSIEKSEELISAAPDEILFALDGASEETYYQYRNFPGVKFEDVLDNLRSLVKQKKEKQRETKIILQFVVMQSNEYEIEKAIALGKEIGVDGIDLKPVSLMAAGTDFQETLRKYLPDSEIRQYEIEPNGANTLKPGYCPFAFSTAVILHNGILSSCCYDFDGSQTCGNAFDSGFKKAWDERAKSEQKKIFKQQLPLCKNCGLTYVRPQRILIN